MIQKICKDMFLLARKSLPATPDDLPVAEDLLDTLMAHRDSCVGMAANMIGVSKRIIVFTQDGRCRLMFNPVLQQKLGPYETQEGCLSLSGTRPALRYQTIQVRWQDERFEPRCETFSGWTAQIIQHELDHCDGILI